MSDGWQVEAREVPPELEQGYFATAAWQEGERQADKDLATGAYVECEVEEAVGRIRENLDLETDRWSPAFAHGVQIIDRLDDTTRAKLGARLRELLDNE